MSKFRRGDKVSIIGIIKHDPHEDKRLFVDVVGSHETLWMEPKDLTLVQYSFEVGDKCRWDGLVLDCATILAISNDHAWIDMGGGAYCTRLMTSISRIDPIETMTEEDLLRGLEGLILIPQDKG